MLAPCRLRDQLCCLRLRAQLRGELTKLQADRDAKVKKGVKPSQSDELALQR